MCLFGYACVCLLIIHPVLKHVSFLLGQENISDRIKKIFHKIEMPLIFKYMQKNINNKRKEEKSDIIFTN